MKNDGFNDEVKTLINMRMKLTIRYKISKIFRNIVCEDNADGFG